MDAPSVAAVTPPVPDSSGGKQACCERCGVSSTLTTAFAMRLFNGKSRTVCPTCKMDIDLLATKHRLQGTAAFAVLALILLQTPKGVAAWLFLNGILIIVMSWIMLIPHELAHAGVARLLGLRVHGLVWGRGRALVQFSVRGLPVQIRAMPGIGLTYSEINDRPGYRLKRILVLLAGPMSHAFMLALGVCFLSGLWTHEDMVEHFAPASVFMIANVLLLVNNLYPRKIANLGLTTDGGQILALCRGGDKAKAGMVTHGAAAEATFHLEAGRWAQAEAVVRQALSIYPQDWVLRLNHGICLAQVEQLPAAIRVTRALLGEPIPHEGMGAIAKNNLAYFELVAGNESQKEQMLSLSLEAYTLLPWLPACISTYGSVQAFYGDPDVALAVLANPKLESCTSWERASIHAAHALAHARKGNAEAAKKLLRLAESLDATSVMLRNARERVPELAGA